MSKTDITYIGPKASKKDTICGTRLVFPRGKAIPVDDDLVPQFLDYPKVWALSTEAKDFIEKQKSDEEEAAKQLEAKKLEGEQRAKEDSFVVVVNEDELDISKYSSKQLETLVESLDLTIDIPMSPVKDYRLAVRNAIRALVPESDSEG